MKIAVFILMLTLAFVSRAFAQTTFTLGLVDATSGAQLSPGDTRLEAEGNEVPLDVAGKRAKFILASVPPLVSVSANVGSPYVARQILVQESAFANRRTFQFAVEKVPEKFTTKHLLTGVRRIEQKEFDKALALFEVAVTDENRKPNADLDDYEAILRFNHARSLQQACLMLNYGTCDDAEKRFTEIAREMAVASKADVYESNSVSRKLVDNALEDLKRRAIKSEYADAVKQVNSGDPAIAQKQFEALVARREREPESFAAVSLPKTRLQSDLGFAVTLQRGAAVKSMR